MHISIIFRHAQQLGITPGAAHFFPRSCSRAKASCLLELLSEEEELDLVVDGKDTSASNTTKDVSTSTLEEGLGTLLGDDLPEGIGRGAVLDGLRRTVSVDQSKHKNQILTSPEVIIIRRRTVSRG